MTKFDELVELNKSDLVATHKYVSQVVNFASVVRTKIGSHLECSFEKVFFLDPDKQRACNPHRTAIIDEEGDLNFQLFIDLGQGGFNINECGRDFFNKGLATPQGLILNLGVRWEGDFFRVKSPSVKDGEILDAEFLLTIEGNDGDWQPFLESCFQSLKLIVGQSLDDRISSLTSGSSSKRAFGFQLEDTSTNTQ